MTQLAQASDTPVTLSSGVVVFTGDLDLATAPALDHELARAAGHPPRHLLVDLSGVTFMDCAGLRPLVAARNRSAAGLSLRNPAPAVLRLLRLLSLTATFAVIGDVRQATTAPAPPAPALPTPALPAPALPAPALPAPALPAPAPPALAPVPQPPVPQQVPPAQAQAPWQRLWRRRRADTPVPAGADQPAQTTSASAPITG